MDAQYTKHVTYKLAYHFVWCPKYRKKMLVGKLATFLEQEIRRICTEKNWPIGVVNLPEYLGSLAGPRAPDEAERDQKEQAQQDSLRRTVTV